MSDPLELNDWNEAWTESAVLFWRPPSPFSQWTRSTFEVEGETFGCSEQFMMAQKARLFGDEETRALVLATDDPREQRALGRKVTPFDHERWEAERFDIVVDGNLHKFRQNPPMLGHLLSTQGRRLVEASPRDRIWGVGIEPTDSRAADPTEWLGLNLLGQVLERVRDVLVDERR